MTHAHLRTGLGWAVALVPVIWVASACAAAGRFHLSWFMLVPVPAVWLVVISTFITAGEVRPVPTDAGSTFIATTDAAGMPMLVTVARPWTDVLADAVRGRILGGGATLVAGLAGWLTGSALLLGVASVLGLGVGGVALLRIVGVVARLVHDETMDAVGEAARTAAVAATGSDDAGALAAEVAREVAQEAIVGAIVDGIDGGE